MLRNLPANDPEYLEDVSSTASWLPAFAQDFHRRFLSLLSFSFRSFPAILSLSIDESAGAAFRSLPSTTPTPLAKPDLDRVFSPHDLRRLESYAANTLDYHVIIDLLPVIAALYFTGPLRASLHLSGVQSALLLAIGCQRRDVDDVARELGLQGPAQLLAMFAKLARKVSGAFRAVLEGEAARDLPDEEAGDDGEGAFRPPLEVSVEADLAEGADEVTRLEKERARAMIDALPLGKYEIGAGRTEEWKEAERVVEKGGGQAKTVSVRRGDESGKGEGKRKAGGAVADAWREEEKSRGKDGGGKKRKKGGR